MGTLLNLSGKIDPQIITVFDIVGRVIAELGIPYVCVGATARDLVLRHGYGAPLQRATQDIDFAIEVPDWAAFETLKKTLEGQGFKATRAQHRLTSTSNVAIDIIPFGQVEGASIAWPPEGEIVMNVLGFQEACNHADWVRIRDNPELDVPVATPAGMALLKLIAWTDRASDLRRKDAVDFAYLLTTYERVPRVNDVLYGAEAHIMEQYDWDITLASAHRLGRDAHDIAQENTRLAIRTFANGSIQGHPRESLVNEMCIRRSDSQYERNKQLLSAFLTGFGIDN